MAARYQHQMAGRRAGEGLAVREGKFRLGRKVQAEGVIWISQLVAVGNPCKDIQGSLGSVWGGDNGQQPVLRRIDEGDRSQGGVKADHMVIYF